MDYQPEEGVITFGQIWRVVKKSLARAVIYVVVCAVVCAAALFAVKSFTVNKSYTARITFNQSDSTIKTTLDGYKATATTNAISSVFGSSDDATKINTEIYEEVLKSLTVTAYIPTEYSEDTTYVATSFIVTFNDLGISGVTAEQQTSLLETICNEFISYYSEINSPDMLSANLAWGYTVNYNVEYVEILSELETRLATLKTTMSANINANVAINGKFATFKSSDTSSYRRTASEILAQIDNLELTVSNLKDAVYNNGITNTNAAVNGADYCTAKLTSLGYEWDELYAVSEIYTNRLTELADVIKSSNSGSTSSTITIDLSEYTSLVEKLVEVTAQMASIETQEYEIASFSLNIDPDAVNSEDYKTVMDATEKTIDSVTEDVMSLIDEYNDLVSEFEEQVMPSSYASVSKPATVTAESAISTSLLVIAVLAVAVLAYVVAFGQTWSAMKKAGTLNGGKPGEDGLLPQANE